MKKLSAIIIAMALVLGLGQCKKQETPTATDTEGEKVYITVSAGHDGAKHDLYPNTGAYVFTNGDKLYVGNAGHYIGTLTYNDGAFSGTITDPNASDFLHFYFVGGLTTTPAELTAGSTTDFTVSIADQSSKLPILSYGQSTAKYTTASATYSTTLRNKCGLVKFVPEVATSQSVIVSGMKTTATIDFAAGGITPTGTTGDITLYSESDAAKWAVLLQQDAVDGATVTIRGYEASVSVPTIPINYYNNSGLGISMTAAYVTYEANNSNWENVLASFNAEPSPNPMLELTGNITIGNTGFAITRADGTIDLKGYTLGTTHATHALFLQNNVLDKSLTIMNGTINAPVDGNVDWNDWYCGTVIFENITFHNAVFFDGHLCELTNVDFASDSYFENYTGGSGNPGMIIINSGKFNCTFHYNGNHATKASTTIYGGKFSTNPSSIANVIIPEGYSIKSNTDSDSGTYPYIVCKIPTGAIGGEFTINGSGDKVYFSKGNLQYIGSAGTPYWKFANNQWDYLGTTTGQNSTSATVDRDLFGWGTSGYNHEAVAYQPWSTSTTTSDYYAYGASTNNLYDGNGKADWGNNAINNGGNSENSGWRTLTQFEWNYVFNTRSSGSTVNSTGNARYTEATINTDGVGVNGIILFPDDVIIENSEATSWGAVNGASSWGTQCTTTQWTELEAKGCVFLPAAGRRNGSTLDREGSYGYYWSSSYYNTDKAYCAFFYSSYFSPSAAEYRGSGYSVRLVRDAQ